MSTPIFGIISPHPPIMVPAVGGSRAEVTHASLDALEQAAKAVAAFAPETIVLMSPHAPALPDAIVVDDAEVLEGSLAQFGDPASRRWAGDPPLAHLLVAEIEHRGLDAVPRTGDARLRAGSLDHGALVPLAFLDPAQHFSLVVVSPSQLLPYAAHRTVGKALRAAAAASGRRVAFVASGDLSHRLTPDAPAGYSERAKELDDAIVSLVERGSFAELPRIDRTLVEAGGECGLRSFMALGGFAGDDPVPTRVLAYEGPWGVGYLTALVGKAALEACDADAFATANRGHKQGTAGSDESEIVRLARRSIEAYVREGRRLATAPGGDGSAVDDGAAVLGEQYPPRAGAFVTLHRGDELRGCIGTILPTRSTLAEEVVANAIEAASRDPRFSPVTAEELDLLDIKVDVLHQPESCSLEELDPKRYGVITSSGWRRGLLLPDLEGVEDVETQVAIAMRKAGIQEGESCSYERFEVDRYT